VVLSVTTPWRSSRSMAPRRRGSLVAVLKFRRIHVINH
jgi:hypothetical protein